MEAALEDDAVDIDEEEDAEAVARTSEEDGREVATSDLRAKSPVDLGTTPPRSPERPRLFDRETSARPELTAEDPAPVARTSPISRQPRMPVTAAPPVAATPAASTTEDQFSPAAIMRREPRVAHDGNAPRRERPRIAARAVPAAPSQVVAAPVSEVEHALVDEAVTLIVARSVELAGQVDPEAKVPVDLILDHARETGEQLQAVVSRGRSEDLRRLTIEVGEMMDLIMLMQLEKGHAPADDALTLILQLKRELETLRAE
ncbi:MAG TPA: hypothetical protein VK181_20330 [Rhizobium sp.]|nr:hypothetical protein [Rhizobium sp.]